MFTFDIRDRSDKRVLDHKDKINFKSKRLLKQSCSPTALKSFFLGIELSYCSFSDDKQKEIVTHFLKGPSDFYSCLTFPSDIRREHR